MPSKPPSRPPVVKQADSLRAIGAEIFGEDDQGRPITRKEKLDRILWQEAIGWTEQTRDANGSLRQIVHPPNIAVALKLKEQLDGKAAVATEVAPTGPSVAARVRALAVDRLNALAVKRTSE
jgi:hypothetical protein